ncbi:YceI family protein [Pseudoclavibacter chungangensis]|uniref:YceI family protein n=1 Tax=Pseudoclavibacter chungangensis TaxID=587635 RepID=A0A7J5BPW1_9MICO|nr:YceI family protein [Pseudoclavibacter chungangensis]NYJ65254.1 polyisoprenoid-binding protein YceI [Pseudoclavibacter chungangensis]
MDLAQLGGIWKIDPGHSRIGFSAKHAMVTKVRGSFNSIVGEVELDPQHWANSSARVVVDLASIDTRNEQRDEHLRSSDFFDVENHPEMVFESDDLEEIGEQQFIVRGTLSIHGITRALSVPLELTGIETDPFGNVRAGLEGSRRIDRRDWGVEWNTPLDSGGLLVSEKISLEFELSLIKEPTPEPDAVTGDEGERDASTVGESEDDTATDVADGAGTGIADDTGTDVTDGEPAEIGDGTDQVPASDDAEERAGETADAHSVNRPG